MVRDVLKRWIMETTSSEKEIVSKLLFVMIVLLWWLLLYVVCHGLLNYNLSWASYHVFLLFGRSSCSLSGSWADWKGKLNDPLGQMMYPSDAEILWVNYWKMKISINKFRFQKLKVEVCVCICLKWTSLHSSATTVNALAQKVSFPCSDEDFGQSLSQVYQLLGFCEFASLWVRWRLQTREECNEWGFSFCISLLRGQNGCFVIKTQLHADLVL